MASGVADPLKVGRDLYDANKFDEAAAEFRQVIKLQPDNAEAHFQLGRYYHARNKLRRGARLLPRGAPAQARRSQQGPCQDRAGPQGAGQGRPRRPLPSARPSSSSRTMETFARRTRHGPPGQERLRRGHGPNFLRRSASSPMRPDSGPISAGSCLRLGEERRGRSRDSQVDRPFSRVRHAPLLPRLGVGESEEERRGDRRPPRRESPRRQE